MQANSWLKEVFGDGESCFDSRLRRGATCDYASLVLWEFQNYSPRVALLRMKAILHRSLFRI